MGRKQNMWILQIFTVVGGAVCVLAGLVVVAASTSLAVDYAWAKFRAVHAIVEIQRAVKAHKASQKEAD